MIGEPSTVRHKLQRLAAALVPAARQRAPLLAGIASLAAAYAIAANIGLQFATADGNVSAVWPASGVALGILLRFGHRLWPGVAIGAMLGSASLGVSVFATAAEGAAATAQALLAVYLLRRVHFSSELDRLRDGVALFAAIASGGLTGALIGVAGLVLGGVIGWTEFVWVALVWFVGDSLGAIVVTPLLLVWRIRRRQMQRRRLVEALLGCGTIVIASYAVLGAPLLAWPGVRMPFAVVPLVVLAAVRFGRRGAATSVAIISMIVLAQTLQGRGVFSQADENASVLVAQLFIAVLATTGLSLAAIIAERRGATEALRSESAMVQRQQRFLEAVLENLGDAVVACDADGSLTVFNRSTRELHGLPPEPIPAQQWAAHYSLYRADGKTPMPPDEVPLYRALWGERVRDAQMVVHPRKLPARRLLASGQIVSEAGERLGAVVAMRDITEQVHLEDQLAHRIFHDPLTGLANRALFADRLQHALVRRGVREDRLAVLLLDLDDFKAVNERLGQDAADQVLIRVARVLELSVRPADTVARFGGDEFAILLEEVRGQDAASRTSERILRALQAPLTIGERSVSVTASIGIAIPTAAYQAADGLLRDAELAMYRAKDLGKNRFEMFEDGLRAAVHERLELKADLERAIRQREFRVHYQPIVQFASGETVGFEALVRWKHPTRGLLGPAKFIPLAEQTGQIVRLGRWVLRDACRQTARWQKRLGTDPSLTVSVNLSARQLDDPRLEADIAAALRDSGLPAKSLTLEITESVLIADPDRTVATLAALRRLGLGVAIDDFGTGYSSLNYLARLPITVLKIDKTFVDTIDVDDHGAHVARLILDLGRTLNLDVVAEGVERVEQVNALMRLGCQLGQGYLFGRPLDASSSGRLIGRVLESAVASPGERRATPPTARQIHTRWPNSRRGGKAHTLPTKVR